MSSLSFPMRQRWKHMGEITFIGDISTTFLCGPRYVMSRFVAVPKKENHAHDTFAVIGPFKKITQNCQHRFLSPSLSICLPMLLKGRGGWSQINERKWALGFFQYCFNTLSILSKPVLKKVPVILTESNFLWVDSKSQLFSWVQCCIREKRNGFFKKSRLFMEIVTTKKRRVDPTLLHN